MSTTKPFDEIDTPKSTQVKFLDRERDTTDKRWSVIFIVILAIWIGSCGYVMYTRIESEFPNATAAETVFEEPSNTTSWIVNMLLLNMNNIDKYYKDSGTIVIWTSVFLYNLCLIWTITGISFDPKLYPHLIISCACCLLTSLVYRTAMYFLHQGTDFQTYYEKFRFWVGPEIIYALICLSNFVIMLRIQASTCNILKKLSRVYFTFRYLILIGLLDLGILGCLLSFTCDILGQVDLHNFLFYIILGGSIYMISWIDFFVKMAISTVIASFKLDQNEER
ncbi:uncharacterized protein LOC131663180 [Phymastichus coffea]|uniref:uncharacterized protein LOC131663180 n=1 Tax=Phymastichus coffea TaxID=108790 RepID=UPI00273C2B8B|nr:uncharacterized protein LOC131663180 [Phymastichus coffea]